MGATKEQSEPAPGASPTTATPAGPGLYRSVALLSVAGLAVLYFVLNPYFFGDATWYALDIGNRTVRPADAGHLLWRPLGQAAWAVLASLGATDPLTALRALSSVAAGALVVATYVLARRLGLGTASAGAAALMVAGSKMALAYGGSGCSYLPAAAFGAAAMLPLARRTERVGVADVILSAGALALAWSMWGIIGLLLPAQLVLAWLTFDGPYRSRSLRVGLLGAATLGAILAIAVAGYLSTSGTHDLAGFTAWLRASGHGDAPKLSVVGFARAGIGFFNSFVHLGSLGTSVKGLILRDPGLVRIGPLLAFGPVLILFVAAVAYSFLGLARGVIRRESWQWPAAGLALAAVVPIAAFAATWRGSDVERFSPAVAFVSVAMVFGMARRNARTAAVGSGALALVVAGALCAGNLATFTTPALVTRGGLVMEVGRAARQHLAAGVLLVVNGRELGPDVVSAAIYFSKLDVYSISYELQVFGSAGWRERLEGALCKAIERGARIAVVSDLLGKPTPGGIGYSPAEFPTPTPDEIAREFTSWEPAGEWSTDRFRFVVVRPGGVPSCP